MWILCTILILIIVKFTGQGLISRYSGNKRSQEEEQENGLAKGRNKKKIIYQSMLQSVNLTILTKVKNLILYVIKEFEEYLQTAWINLYNIVFYTCKGFSLPFFWSLLGYTDIWTIVCSYQCVYLMYSVTKWRKILFMAFKYAKVSSQPSIFYLVIVFVHICPILMLYFSRIHSSIMYIECDQV